MKVTLLLPTLNEIEGLKAVMPDVRKEWVDQILVVDGGSTDGTLEYAKQNGWDIVHQTSRGVRHAYREAWPMISGDAVITFSPDGNCIPGDIPVLIEKLKSGYDMVIASRYLGDAKSEDDDALTGVGNWVFTRLINLLHGGRYTDAMTIYRIYYKDLPLALNLFDQKSHAMEEFWGCHGGYEPLMSVRAAKLGLKVTEIPSPEPPRIGGKRKLRPFHWGMFYLLQVLRETFYWRGQAYEREPSKTATELRLKPEPEIDL